MKFSNVTFNGGEMYYVGEARKGYYGYDPAGIGAMKWACDGKIVMCNNYTADGINGLGFEYYPDRKYGSLSTYKFGKFYGPTLSFGYESYLMYENYDYNEKPQNFSVYVYYDGGYVIYEESNQQVLNGVEYNDGYLYFVKLDRRYNILSRKTIKYVGSEYAFSTKRMFCMPLDENKYIFNKSGVTSDGYHYDLGVQVLSQYSNEYFGYGAIRWNDGSYYFGEWYNDNREGIGCYVEEDGSKYMGKFYKNKRYGNGLSVYSNGIIKMSNWVEGKREGISFQIGDDYVVIVNYKSDSVYGNKFQVNKGAEYVTEFNNSGTVGSYYY